jgi:hypothetical protein
MESDKFTKRAIAIGALMAGVGVFYHYVIFIPGLEKSKQERIDKEKSEADMRTAEKSRQYEFCKTTARQVYEEDWANACQSVAEDRKLQYDNCLKDRMVMTNQFMGKQYCVSTYGKIDASSGCTLPGGRADTINESFKDAKDKCLVEFKNGL